MEQRGLLLMASISEMSTFIQELLNTNALGDVFKVYYWAQNLDTKVEQLYSNNQPTTKQEFIPCIISDITGQYRAIPDSDISDNSILLEIIFPLKQKADIESVYNSILAGGLIGKSYVIGTSRCVFNIEKPILAQIDNMKLTSLNELDSRIQFKKTEMYGVMDVRIYYCDTPNASGFEFGNDFDFYISTESSALTKLVRLDANQQVARNTLDEQYMGQNATETFNEINGVGFTITFLLKNRASSPMSYIYLDATEGGNQHRVYTIQRKMGSTQVGSIQYMLMTSAQVNYTLGSIVTITATFKKALDGLVS